MVRFKGWHVKNMALKRGAGQNSRACKKGVNRKIPLSFAVTTSVIIQTFNQKLAQISRRSMPLEPLLCALEQFYHNCCLIAKYSQKINLGETILKW